MGSWCSKGYFNLITGINDPSYHFRRFNDNYYHTSNDEKYCMYLVHRQTGTEDTTQYNHYNLWFGEIGTNNHSIRSTLCDYSTFVESIQSEASEPHEPIEIETYQYFNSSVENPLIGSVIVKTYIPEASFITNIPIFEDGDTDSISDYVKNGVPGQFNKGVKVVVVLDPNNLNFEIGVSQIEDEERTQPTDIDKVVVTVLDTKTSGSYSVELHNMDNINSYNMNKLFYNNVNLVDIIDNNITISANYNVGSSGVAISDVHKGEMKNTELKTMPCVLEYSESNEPLDGDTDNRDSEDFVPLEPDDSTVTTKGVLTTTYKMNYDKLVAFGNWLWNLDLSQVGYSHVNDNPIENVISLKSVPFDFESTTEQAIKLGNLLSPTATSSPVISNETTVIKRTITVGEILKYQYRFMNYGNYTKVQLYAPFFGLIDLSNEDVIGTYKKLENGKYKEYPKGVNLKYTVDCVTGEITLEVTSIDKGNVVYSATSNCGFEIPLFATNRAMKEQAIVDATDVNKMSAISNASNIVNSALNPSINSAISTLGASINNSIQQDMTMRQAMAIGFSVSQKGQTGGKSACNIYNRAYIIVTFPNYVEIDDFQLRKGRPVMKTMELRKCRDFIKFDKSLKIVANTDEQAELLHNANLTNEFKEMIYNYLTSGVYYTP